MRARGLKSSERDRDVNRERVLQEAKKAVVQEGAPPWILRWDSFFGIDQKGGGGSEVSEQASASVFLLPTFFSVSHSASLGLEFKSQLSPFALISLFRSHHSCFTSSPFHLHTWIICIDDAFTYSALHSHTRSKYTVGERD